MAHSADALRQPRAEAGHHPPDRCPHRQEQEKQAVRPRVPRMVDLSRRPKGPRGPDHPGDDGHRASGGPHGRENQPSGAAEPEGRGGYPDARRDAQHDSERADDPADRHRVAERRDAAHVEERRPQFSSLRDVDAVECEGDRHDVFARRAQCPR